MKPAVLCDFDGTVVEIDTIEYLLTNFVHDDWQHYNNLLEQGKISLEECLQKQVAMIPLSQEAMLQELERVTAFRPRFDGLLHLCQIQHVPCIIVSAGLDFVIYHFFASKGWQELVKIYAPQAIFSSHGISVVFPKACNTLATDFKVDLVDQYKEQKYTVLYVGDGLSDYNAIKHADVPFAIVNSKLAKLCEINQIYHQTIYDFHPVMTAIKTYDSV